MFFFKRDVGVASERLIVNNFEGDNFEGFNGDDSPSISLISLLVFCQRTLFSKIGLGDDDFGFHYSQRTRYADFGWACYSRYTTT